MKKTPPKGMNDYLPNEVALRSYMQEKILDTYCRYGFQRISTPVVDAAENLEKSEGGENLNLIFQVMKRGDKLKKALETGDKLWDLGLRYDLTVPMVRYYCANEAKLPSPFKCIQADRVYRAERPQKGRLREFMQCDIDIIGTASLDAEKELIAVTAEALTEIGFSGFTMKINHRQLVNQLLLSCGFQPENFEIACIALDKLDKVGVEGVTAFMQEHGLDNAAIEQIAAILSRDKLDLAVIAEYLPENESITELSGMTDSLNSLSDKWSVQFDLTVIRGQGYYTGTVFEIVHPGYRGSIGGGGRYDGMVGKFMGKDVPAVGFSIGFERIYSILAGEEYQIPGKPKLALVYNEGTEFTAAFQKAGELQQDYIVSLVVRKKSFGKMKKRLIADGFSFILELGRDIEPLQQ